LPVLCARGIRAAGHPVACVGLSGQYEPQLPALCDQFARAAVVRLGQWIRLLRRWGVRDAIMVGRVSKTKMYDPLRVFRQLPDFRAARLWYRTLRHDRRSDALLVGVAGELARAGITLIDTARYIPEHMAHQGIMTRTRPTSAQLADIEFGLPILRQIGNLDIGQAIAVKEREVIAVEAMEGTDAMIRRAGELCRSGKWVLLKIAKPRQDMRFDVPTIGLDTIKMLKQSRGSCLAVEAERSILLNKPQVLEAADAAGIAVVGIG